MANRAEEVFNVMKEQAVDNIWEGRLTELVAGMGYMSYYGRITAALRNSGAAKQLRRGAMGVPSTWEILDPDADFTTAKGPRGGIIPKRDALESRIEGIEKMLGGLDMPLALSDIIRRLEIIELFMLGKGGEDGEANGNRPAAGDPAT